MSMLPIGAQDRSIVIETMARLAVAEGRRIIDYKWLAARLTIVASFTFRLMDRRSHNAAQALHAGLLSGAVAWHPSLFARVQQRVDKLWSITDGDAPKQSWAEQVADVEAAEAEDAR